MKLESNITLDNEFFRSQIFTLQQARYPKQLPLLLIYF